MSRSQQQAAALPCGLPGDAGSPLALVKRPTRRDETRFMERDLSRHQGRWKSQLYKWEQTLCRRLDLQPVLLGMERCFWGSFSYPRGKRGSEYPPARLWPLCLSLDPASPFSILRCGRAVPGRAAAALPVDSTGRRPPGLTETPRVPGQLRCATTVPAAIRGHGHGRASGQSRQGAVQSGQGSRFACRGRRRRVLCAHPVASLPRSLLKREVGFPGWMYFGCLSSEGGTWLAPRAPLPGVTARPGSASTRGVNGGSPGRAEVGAGGSAEMLPCKAMKIHGAGSRY